MIEGITEGYILVQLFPSLANPEFLDKLGGICYDNRRLSC